MVKPERTESPQYVPNWVLFCNELIDRAYLVIRVNVVWCGLTLLGVVLLGVVPATAAAADAFIAGREGRKVRVLPLMWASFRAQFVSANVRIFPFVIVQAGGLAVLQIAMSGAIGSTPLMVALSGVATISLAWTTSSSAAIISSPRLRRQDLIVAWRLTLLIPGVLPVRSIAVFSALLTWVLMCSLIWPMGLLVGAAVSVDAAVVLFGRKVEMLLRRVDSAQDALFQS